MARTAFDGVLRQAGLRLSQPLTLCATKHTHNLLSDISPTTGNVRG